ncbi:MAG: cell division protein FtsZ [Ignavibacteria bacterium]
MSLNRLDHIPPRRNYAIFIAPEEEDKPVAKIKIVGVGGGGCNAINSMITRGLNGVEFIAINTDVQSLNTCLAQNKIQIGASITRGLGTGGNVELGRKAAEEDKEKILKAISGAEMVFITTGEGGGTGTGASPVVASFAKSNGALVVGIVTKPSILEGNPKTKIAEKGIMELRDYCDSLIVIPNDNIPLAIDKNSSVFIGYDKPNEVLYNAVKGISDLILKSGTINVDFADVKTVLRDSGDAIIGIGRASGENKVIEAFNKAISSPLLEEVDLRRSHSILINFTGSESMTYYEIVEAMKRLQDMLNPNVSLKFGVVKDDDLGEEVMVTIIATGYTKTGEIRKTIEPTTGLSFISEDDKKTSNEAIVLNELTPSDHIPDDLIYDPSDLDIFDIPTIRRVKGDQSNNKQTGTINKNYEDETQNEIDSNFLDDIKKRKNKDDEDDKSEFLRKLMD